MITPSVPAPAPLAIGPEWDWIRAIEWSVLACSRFAEAAKFLGLPMRRDQDGNYVIVTTLDELMWVVAYDQNKPQPKVDLPMYGRAQ